MIVRVGALLLSFVVFTLPVSAANQDAENLANQIYGQVGNKEGLKENFMEPLTSGGQMQTFDGSQTFDVQAPCPSSAALLDLSVAAGTTGDIQTLTLNQDTDMNGTRDYNYSAPFQVSGVCENGVIACTPGTWTNCSYYKWRAGTDYRVSLTPSAIVDLAGCYCVNNSCGGSFVNDNLNRILKSLGDGATEAIKSAYPEIAITQADISNSSITYYGQDPSNCPSVPTGSGSSNPQQYYGNEAALSAAVTAEVSTQAADPDSAYSQIYSGSTNPDFTTCSINRVVTITEYVANDIVAPNGGTGQVRYTCGPDCIEVVLGTEGDNYWPGSCTIYEEDFNVFVKYPDKIQSATLTRAKWDDYMQVWIAGTNVWSGPNSNFPPETAGACELSTSWDQNPGLDVTGYFNSVPPDTNVQTKVRVSVTGAGEGFAIVQLGVNLTPDLSESINDLCATLDSNPDCRLQDENVDGVFTYQNFQPTLDYPASSCKDIVGSLGGIYTECCDWWDTQRTYLCESSPASYDFSDIQERVGHVTQTTTGDGSGFFYEDYTQDESGNWTVSPTTVTGPGTDSYPDCESFCKVQTPVDNTEAGADQSYNIVNSTQYQISDSTYEISYRSCGLDNVCPIDSGDTILEDCQCIDDFAEAASIMTALNEVGEDITCMGTIDPATGACSGEFYLFNAQSSQCRAAGWQTQGTPGGCCDSNCLIPGVICPDCSSAEKDTVNKRDNGLCVYIGSYCIESWPLAGCVQEEDSYCCFNSKLGRIIHEQGRPQLQAFGASGGWGLPDNPNCRGFTPEEFQMLDFSRIDLSEYFGDLAPNITGATQDAQDGIQDFYEGIR